MSLRAHGSRWACAAHDPMFSDFKHALKRLSRSPGFVSAVVAMLAIGLGATTAVVRTAREALFPRLLFPQSERLAVLDEWRDGTPYILVPHRFEAYREHAASCEIMAAERTEEMNLVLDGQPYFVNVSWVTDEYFPVFGVAPRLGRLFARDDHNGSFGGSVAVISTGLWSERFNADPQVIGRSIQLGGHPRTIIGVLPASFTPPPEFNQTGMYLPNPPIRTTEYPIFQWLKAVVRLRPGVSVAQAQAELQTIKPADPSNLVDSYKNVSPHLTPLRETYLSDETRLFWVFMGIAAFLYAIACSNAANLMLARTIDRRRELAVRLALGGTRWQIVRLVLAESAVLAALASLVGALVAQWAYWAITSLQSEKPAAGGFVLGDAWAAVAFIALNVLAAGLIAVIPAFRIARSNLSETLKAGTGMLGDSPRLRRLRSSFVILQAALAVTLLAGAGLMIRSFRQLQHVNLGFDPSLRYGIFSRLEWGTPIKSYLSISESVRERLAAMPGVERVALADVVPLAGSSSGSVRIVGRPDLGDIRCAGNCVSPDFFSAIGIPVLIGRGFDGLRPGGAPVAVINETMARRFFADHSPLGQYLDPGDGSKAEIIGVVGDVHQSNQRETVIPQYYSPFWMRSQYDTYALSILLKTAGSPGLGFETRVRRAIYEAAPEVVPEHITPLPQLADANLRVERYTLILLQVASALALTLSATGLFAVMAFSVAQQQREFGLRMALGASERSVEGMVILRGLVLAGIGVVFGLAGTWALTRYLQSVLFETSAHDPVTLLAVAPILLIVAALASWLPARRAARADPMIALRAE